MAELGDSEHSVALGLYRKRQWPKGREDRAGNKGRKKGREKIAGKNGRKKMAGILEGFLLWHKSEITIQCYINA